MNRYGAGRPATKAELVKIRGELKVAVDGLDLLENKRDLLMREAMRRLREAADLRKALTGSWARLDATWSDCLAREGAQRLSRLAESVQPAPSLSGRAYGWMGVQLADYTMPRPDITLLGAVFDCGIRPERVRGMTADLLPDLVRLMNLETNVRRISSVLKRCQRQVNALRNVIIPDLAFQEKVIQQRLEEKEREALFQSKRLKAKAA